MMYVVKLFVTSRRRNHLLLAFVVIASIMIFRTKYRREKIVILSKTNCKEIMSEMNRDKVAADNKDLIEILRTCYIEPPSNLPYNLSRPKKENPSPGQTQFVDELLNEKRNGFYVDCGAYNGEHLSNSLFLERSRNWTGILIEPNPVIYQQLKCKNRKAYSLNSCLSTKRFPTEETFFAATNAVMGKVVNPSDTLRKTGRYIHVQCFPLYSILLALNQLHVDYFSLDIEGAELGVLESIPWDKVNISVFSIEHNKWPGGKENLKSYMTDKGYDFLTEIKIGVAPDLIFMKRKE